MEKLLLIWISHQQAKRDNVKVRVFLTISRQVFISVYLPHKYVECSSLTSLDLVIIITCEYLLCTCYFLIHPTFKDPINDRYRDISVLCIEINQ
jgi:hypothetical protein